MGNAQKAVDLGLSLLGKNQYTQTYLRTEVFNGWSDCSSLCWKLYEKAYGIYVGSWTGEQVLKGRLLFKRGSRVSYAKITAEEMKKLQPGDLLFYGDGGADHVEMYIGDGKQIGHGHGWGPIISNTLNYSHSSGFYQARRYVADDATTEQPATKKAEPETAQKRTSVKSIADKQKTAYVGTYKVVDVDYLCFRTAADTSDSKNIMAKLQPGEYVHCYGGYYREEENMVWLYVGYGNRAGFVSMDYLEKV